MRQLQGRTPPSFSRFDIILKRCHKKTGDLIKNNIKIDFVSILFCMDSDDADDAMCCCDVAVAQKKDNYHIVMQKWPPTNKGLMMYSITLSCK